MKISSAIGTPKRVRPFTSERTALQICQEAARVITRSGYDASASFLLNRLHWDNLTIRRKKLKAILMIKTINELSPGGTPI
ncbi:unnamed protein product [Porites evermanni]|uniref:Uncharacterized protein n=1 Tax=Porites evermanni TaxID=104178 RepID=A0ABN8NC86_9CNID|nr:unnamed protein product [Porites evermanni]